MLRRSRPEACTPRPRSSARSYSQPLVRTPAALQGLLSGPALASGSLSNCFRQLAVMMVALHFIQQRLATARCCLYPETRSSAYSRFPRC